MILVTGASGFLGKIICEEFKSNIKKLGRLDSNDICCDLSKEIPVLGNYKLVIHSAGKAHSIPKSEGESNQFYEVNVEGTLNLLRGLEKEILPREFVFISSVAVYGQETGNDISENHQLLAKDPYGLSKIKAEEIIIDWCKLNNVICTILRLPLLVGKNPPGNLGAMIKAISKGYYFNIAEGKAKKSMILAKDVALFISLASSTGGIYNLTDGYDPSFSELSQMISKKKSFSMPFWLAVLIGKIGNLIGNKAPLTSLKVKKITSDLTFDDSKARQLFNWKPEPVLDYLKRENI